MAKNEKVVSKLPKKSIGEGPGEGIATPSAENSQENFVKAVCQGLGALVYGETGVDSAVKLLSLGSKNSVLIGKIDNISTILSDIKDNSFKDINSNLSNINNFVSQQLVDALNNMPIYSNINSTLNNILIQISELHNFIKDNSSLSSIEENMQNTNELINALYSELDLQPLNTTIDGMNAALIEFNKVLEKKQEISITFGESDNIVKLVDALENYVKISKSEDIVEKVINTVKKLNSISELDTKDIENKLSIIHNVLLESDISLLTILTDIETLFKDKQIDFDKLKTYNQYLINFELLISILSNIGNKNNLTEVKRNLIILSGIISKKGELPKVYDNFFNFIDSFAGKINEDKEKAIKAVQTVADILYKISNIGNNDSLLSFYKFKLKIKQISKFIINDFPVIMSSINKTLQESNKKESTAIRNEVNAINSIISLITNIGNAEFAGYFKLKANSDKLIFFINEFLNEISTSLNENAVKFDKNTSDSLKLILTIIENIINLGNFKLSNIYKMQLKVDMITDIISDCFSNLIEEISNFNISNDPKDPVVSKLNALTNISVYLKLLISSLPEAGKVFKALFSLTILIAEVDLLGDIIDSIKSIQTLQGIPQKMQSLNNLIDQINELNNKLPQLKILIESTLKLSVINKEFEKLNETITIVKGLDLSEFSKVIDKLNTDIILPLNSLENINAEKLESITSGILNIAKAGIIIGIVGLLGKLVEKGANVLLKITDTVKQIITNLNDIDSKNIDNALQIIKEFSNLIIKASMVLILGTLVASILNFGDLIMFSASLTLFIVGISFAIKQMTTTVKEGNNTINDFTKLVIASGAILLVGSLVIKLINLGDLLLFPVILVGFISLLSLPFLLFNKFGKEVTAGLKDFGIFVVTCGMVLVLGSLIYKMLDLGSLIGFGGTLIAFMIGLSIPFLLFNKFGKEVTKGLKDFGIFVVTCGMLLILGSLIYKMLDLGSLIAFGATLIAFMIGLSIPFLLFNKAGKSVMSGLRNFGIFVVTCGILLVLGSLIYNMLDLGALLGFSVTLIAFMTGLLLPFMIAGKQIEKGIKHALKLALMVVICGSVLILGAKLLKSEDILGLILFLAGMGLIIFGIYGLMKFLGKSNKDLAKGMISMVLIGVVAGMFTGILFLIGHITQKYSLLSILGGVGIMTLIIVAFGALMIGAGTLVMGPQALFFFAGVAVMNTIAGVALIVSLAMMAIAAASNAMAGVKEFDSSIILNNIKSFIDITSAVLPLANKVDELIKVSIAVAILSNVVTTVGKAVKDFSELKLPIYKGTEVIGYRALTEKDFDNASKNVAKIITTLSQAIINVYHKNPTMFETSLLSPNTIFGIVVKSVSKLGGLISDIANGLKNYAALRVADQWDKEGKPIHYINLFDKDLTKAGENIGKIITTISQAIMNIYNKKPELFDVSLLTGNTIFSVVVKSVGKLGGMISNIASGLKDYANLQVADQWDKEGRPIHYVRLTDKELFNASENIGKIITTLSNAVMTVYDANPALFEVSLLSGKSKFDKVAKSIGKLGDMISNIASGLKDYANLQVADQWDKEGKPIHYMRLTDKDLLNASKNIGKIITTLSNTIITIYDENPALFEGSGILGSGKSKFDKVAKSIGNLGNMISNIADGLQNYANLQYAVSWNKEGKPIKFKKMSDNDIKKAAKTINKVITTLAKSIIDTYNENPDMFEGSGWFGAGESNFDKVARSFKGLGKLITEICVGLQNYANLQYAVDWDKEGKAIKFKRLTDSDIKKAAKALDTVITTLAKTIIDTYNNNPDMFEGSGWFGNGESNFDKVARSFKGLGKLITEICVGLQNYANLQYAVEWDKEGKAIKYKRLTDKDIQNAGANISKVITTIAQAIIDTYNNNPDMFAGTGWFGLGESNFDKVARSFKGLGKLVADIATGLQNYATLQYADEWNDEGVVTHYSRLSDADIQNAGKNIGIVVTTLAQALMDVYNKHTDWFDTGLIGLKESPFSKMMTSFGGLGKMLSDIATGLQNYAALQFADKWNSEGVATHYKKLNDTDFVTAAENIGKVITALAQAIIDTHNNNPEMFVEVPNDGIFAKFTGKKDPSPFARVMSSMNGLGNLVSGIAEGILTFSQCKFVDEYDDKGNPIKYVSLTDDKFANAAKNIGEVIKFLGWAIIDVYNKNPQIFEDEVVSKGLFGWRKEKVPGSSPFAKAINAMGGLGGLIAGIAMGISEFANMKYATDWDKDGKAIKWHHLTPEEMEKAGINVGNTITTLANAVINVSKGATWLDIIKAKNLVVPMLNSLSNCIGDIGRGLQIFSIDKIPVVNKDGKVIDTIEVNYPLARYRAKKAIMTLAETLIEIQKGKDWESIIKAKGIADTINAVSGAILPIAKGLQMFGLGQVPIKFDKNGNPTDYVEIDYDAAAVTAGKVITTLANVIVDIYKGNKSSDFWWKLDDFVQAKTKVLPLLNEVKDILSPLTESINAYALGQLPIKFDKEGRPIEYKTVDFDAAAITAGKVITTLANVIIDIYKGNSRSYKLWTFDDFNEAKTKVLPLLSEVIDILSPLTESISAYALGQLPIKFDKEGRPIEYKNVDFDAASLNISKVITTLANVIVDIYKGNKSSWVFGDVVQAKTKVLPLLSEVIDILSPLTESISAYALGQLPIKFDNEGRPIAYKTVNFDKAAESVTKVFTTLIIGLQNVLNDPNNKALLGNDASKTFGLLNTFIDNIQEINEKLINIENININDKKYIKIITSIKNINNEINTLKSNFLSKIVINNLFKTFKYLIYNLLTVKNLAKPLNNIENININDKKYIKIITSIKNINNEINTLKINTLKSNILSKIAIDNLFKPFKYLIYNLLIVKNLAKPLNNEDYDVLLANQIKNLDNAVNNIKGSPDSFTKQTRDIGEFVSKINLLNTSKADSLRKLINSISLLSLRMGNMDKLVDALVNKLAIVLDKLTRELNSTKNTLKIADSQHEKRKKLIEESIKTIKEIMDKKLLVEVTQQENTEDFGKSSSYSNSSNLGFNNSSSSSNIYNEEDSNSGSSTQVSIPSKSARSNVNNINQRDTNNIFEELNKALQNLRLVGKLSGDNIILDAE